MNRTTSITLLAAAAGATLWLSAAPARAQMMHVPTNDWRQNDRHDSILNNAAKPSWVLELRFGPYLPGIDSEFESKNGVKAATPFADIFSLDCSKSAQGQAAPTGSVTPRFSFGVELDYLAVRIPFVGAIGPGVGWSYTAFSNYMQETQHPGVCASEETTLTIMPMHASVVLRADELMRRTGIPIVPYGKFGVGMAYWRSSDDSGTEKVCGTKAAPTACAATTDTAIASGIGITPSLHFALGAMLALNFLEPMTAARLDESTGVHHAYLFGEYYNEKTTLATNVLHVGASSWVGGLAVDF
jgi:hypothetical protein